MYAIEIDTYGFLMDGGGGGGLAANILSPP